jgi:hypothetical protein
MNYLIEYNNNIIGIYNEYKLAENFILSCYQNNLMTNLAKIILIEINTCLKIKSVCIENPNISNKNVNVNNPNNQNVHYNKLIDYVTDKLKSSIELFNNEDSSFMCTTTTDLYTDNLKLNDENNKILTNDIEFKNNQNNIIDQTNELINLNNINNTLINNKSVKFENSIKSLESVEPVEPNDSNDSSENSQFSDVNEFTVEEKQFRNSNNVNTDKLVDLNEEEEIINLDNISTFINDINYKLNSLKKIRDKIKEYKNKFNIDIQLFNKFLNNLNNDNQFIIPELFLDKFNIFKKLHDENNLSWENFSNEYYKDDPYINNEIDLIDDKSNVLNINEEFEIE